MMIILFPTQQPRLKPFLLRRFKKKIEMYNYGKRDVHDVLLPKARTFKCSQLNV